jgi:hypothetical protein
MISRKLEDDFLLSPGWQRKVPGGRRLTIRWFQSRERESFVLGSLALKGGLEQFREAENAEQVVSMI